MAQCLAFFFKTIIFIFIFSTSLYAQKNSKNSIEDIFIWKVSDELQLTAQQEKQFSDTHKALNKKKFELTEVQQSLTQSLKKKSLTDNEIKKLLLSFRSNLNQLNEVTIQEYEQTKKILGHKKMAEYLVFKQELADKFKSLLADQKLKTKDSENKKSSEMSAPSVIEEK